MRAVCGSPQGSNRNTQFPVTGRPPSAPCSNPLAMLARRARASRARVRQTSYRRARRQTWRNLPDRKNFHNRQSLRKRSRLTFLRMRGLDVLPQHPPHDAVVANSSWQNESAASHFCERRQLLASKLPDRRSNGELRDTCPRNRRDLPDRAAAWQFVRAFAPDHRLRYSGRIRLPRRG